MSNYYEIEMQGIARSTKGFYADTAEEAEEKADEEGFEISEVDELEGFQVLKVTERNI